MRSVSQTMLICTTGADPEIRMTKNNKTMAVVTAATNKQYNDRETNERKESTEWHRLVFWGKTAELVQEYMKQGQLVYVLGENKTRKYQIPSEDKPRHITEIHVSEFKILSKKGDTKTPVTELKVPDLESPPF